MTAAHDAYAALRYRDYRCLLGSAVLASIAGGAQTVAVGWELFERTGSNLMLGLTGLAQFLPVLLLALPAGQAADRFNRKHLFQLSQGLALLASLGLAWLSLQHGPVELIFLCLVGVGTARALGAPARIALLPQVVPPEALHNAVTWNSTGWQFASVTGPALGGLVLGLTSSAGTYLGAAACSFASVLLLIPIRPTQTFQPHTSLTLKALLAGVRFVWRTELLLAAITLDLFAVLLGGATALLPAYAKDILHVGAFGLGCLRAAPALGALLMAVTLAHRRPLQRPGQALLLSVAGFGLATVGFGLSTNVVLSFVMLALTGALDNISVVVRSTLMQKLTPDEMRGRVAAVNIVFISSSNELGEFESGAVATFFAKVYSQVSPRVTGDGVPDRTAAELFGTVSSVVFGGIGTIVVVLLVLARWPRLLRLGPLHTIGQEKAEEAVLEASTSSEPRP